MLPNKPGSSCRVMPHLLAPSVSHSHFETNIVTDPTLSTWLKITTKETIFCRACLQYRNWMHIWSEIPVKSPKFLCGASGIFHNRHSLQRLRLLVVLCMWTAPAVPMGWLFSAVSATSSSYFSMAVFCTHFLHPGLISWLGPYTPWANVTTSQGTG